MPHGVNIEFSYTPGHFHVFSSALCPLIFMNHPALNTEAI